MATGTGNGGDSGGGLRIGFAGTPEFAARILDALIAGDAAPVVVYTQPDRPFGRGRKPQPSPVKRLATAQGIPVRQPASLRGEEAAETLAEWRLDVLVVAAYGLILPQSILDVPRLGCINVHPSLLPRWRGAAPVERTILAGDREAGVCIMRMTRGLDSGPVYLTRRTAVGPDEDAPALEARLAELGGAALLDCLAALPEAAAPTPQAEAGLTYAEKLTREEAALDFSASAAAEVRRVRAFAGRQGAFAYSGDVRVNVLAASAEDRPAEAESATPGTIVSADRRGIRVACGDGVLVLNTVRLSVGKGRPLSAADAANGYAALFRPGTQLSPEPAR